MQTQKAHPEAMGIDGIDALTLLPALAIAMIATAFAIADPATAITAVAEQIESTGAAISGQIFTAWDAIATAVDAAARWLAGFELYGTFTGGYLLGTPVGVTFEWNPGEWPHWLILEDSPLFDPATQGNRVYAV